MLRAVEALWRPDGTKNDNAEARNWVEKAIELDPKFAEAYAFLGWTYCNDAVNLWSQSRKVDLERASEFALKALALDDSNGDALALLARYDLMQRLFDQAVAAGERAIAIKPNYAMSYMALSEALNASGKPEAGIRAAEKGMRLDPSSEDFYAAWTGCAYTIMGRYEEAIAPFRRHLAVYPNNIVARFYLAVAYEELGRDQAARAEVAEVMRISPHFVMLPPDKGVLRDVAMNRRFNADLRKAGLK